ncbi:MAG TPA: transposase [Gammaproteobacteria bacterium]|nr:transposase [Gammaproteobacteria bacterium]
MTAALAGVDPDLAAVSSERPPAPDPTAVPVVAALLAALGESDLLPEVPQDVPNLLGLLPRADLYVQDEVQIALHPTLTRVWSAKGHGGQRLVRAPGTNQKCYGFGQVDWRDGGLSFGFSPRRDADTFCLQLDDAVTRSQERGRVAIILCDNAKTHTPKGSKRVRETLARHADALRLVYTPAYDPDSNPIERLWRVWRRDVTHNHHRDDFWDLYADAEAEVERFQADPAAVLRHIGSIPPERPADDTADDELRLVA